MKYDSTSHLYGNFMQYEVARSSTAIRLGIDNTPTKEALENAKYHAKNCLQPIRDHFGIPYAPQSWYRSETLERIITKRGFSVWCKKHGLDPNDHAAWAAYFMLKSHPTGSATDIELPGISNDDLFNWCKANLDFDQLIREYIRPGEPASGWVHISSLKTGNRQQAFRIW